MFTSELKLITGLINDHNEKANKELAEVLKDTEPFTDQFYIKALPVATEAYKDLAEVANSIRQAFGMVAQFRPEKKVAFDLINEAIHAHSELLEKTDVKEGMTKGATYQLIIKHYADLMFSIGDVADELEEKMKESV